MYIIFRNNTPINSYQSIPYHILGIEQNSNPTAEELAQLDCYTFVDSEIPPYDYMIHYVSEVWNVNGTTCTRTWELLPSPDENEAWVYIREKRNKLLTDCDWTQIMDVDLSLAEKDAWHVYRQALRDITDDYASPQEVVWPTPPEKLPAPQYPVYDIFEFLNRFTLEERTAGRVVSMTDPLVADYLQLSMAVQTIDTNDSRIQQGMDYLVLVGVITEQRKLEILGW